MVSNGYPEMEYVVNHSTILNGHWSISFKKACTLKRKFMIIASQQWEEIVEDWVLPIKNKERRTYLTMHETYFDCADKSGMLNEYQGILEEKCRDFSLTFN